MRYKIIIVLLVISKNAKSNEFPRILENTREENDRGYNFRYSTSDGQERKENGQFEKMGENLILRVSGFYSYISNDGSQFKVFYQADEDGYKPRIESIKSLSTPTIGEGKSKQEFKMKNASLDSLTALTTDESPEGTNTKPVLNLTQTTPTNFIGLPSPDEIVSQISSGAIASLAGGGLG
ncbi:larval cuticle protein 16/17-like [Leptinotarsa decemlineata]|uniref:larval cuticle protein 16/17-like n=1 Tax=Leptinotarsa decemlineata TaxID=7539 RepID=UPI003D305906